MLNRGENLKTLKTSVEVIEVFKVFIELFMFIRSMGLNKVNKVN